MTHFMDERIILIKLPLRDNFCENGTSMFPSKYRQEKLRNFVLLFSIIILVFEYVK